jgi:WD40 domain-containing protein
MKRLLLCSLICFVAASIGTAQQKKATAPSAATAAAKICAEPYAVTGNADGWPEGPITILFHREKSKAPWSRNPAIKVPGLEATTSATARTLVCIEESLLEMGRYDSGEAAYSPSWHITLLRMSDHKMYLARAGFFGDNPPGMKFQRGAGIGKPPIETFVRWLRLIADQKVARLKMRLSSQSYEDTSALAFSPDGTKLAMAQQGRSSSSGATPPSPITVFDLTTEKIITTLVPSLWAHNLAFSKSGNMLAADGYRHVEIWDVSAGKVVHRFEAPEVESLEFSADGSLAVAGGDQATLWDVAGERKLRSVAGAYFELSSSGKWLVAKREPRALTVQEFESGQVLAKFPAVGRETKFAITDDGRAMVRYSVLGGSMYVAGSSEARSIALPSVGVGVVYAVAPMRGGFVVGNGDGVVGLISASNPEPRAFATDHTSIKAVAVSADGKLLAVGDSRGGVTVWELR